jgi:signal recognition particle subunit SRP54
MARRMLRSEFTLEDFAFQLKQVSKLGSMSDLLGMLPNMGINRNMAAADFDDKKIKHMVAIINSMTPRERHKPKILNGKRRFRISKGSGRPVQEVNQLIKRFSEAQKVMKKPIFRKMMKKFDFLSKMG